MSKKYFINNQNTSFGNALLNELVKQATQQPVHMCTMRNDLNIKPNGIKKILKRQKPKLFAKKAIQECQVYVYNIDQTDVQDIQFGLQMMKKPFEENKIFILVSDIMVWSQTGKKVKKNVPPPNDEQNGEQGVEQEQNKNQQNQPQASQPQNQEKDEDTNQNKQEKQNKQNQEDQAEQQEVEYTYWQDTDFKERKSHPKYQYIKQIQDKILDLKRENVKFFIVCPGIIYGCGQNNFYTLFKAAWLQQPKKLPYLGEGYNLVPTIHLKDLVKFVIKLAENPPQQSSPYLLAFDQTKQKSQKNLILAISEGIGSGEIQSVESSPLLQNEERFRLNIDISPSKFFIGTQQEPVQFQWTAKSGVKSNIKDLLKDFCEKQNLRPIKLVIYQKEKDWEKNSKISFILESFSNYYRIPVLTITKILEYAKEFAPEELLQDLNDQWQNIMDYLRKGQEKLGLDETLKVLYRCIRWRLLRNDCSNRGYILHNYPNYRAQLQFIFNKISSKKFKRKVPKKKKEIPLPQKQEEKQQKQGDQENENQNNQENENKEQVQNDQVPPQEQQPPAQPQEEEGQQQEEQQNAIKVQSYYPQTLISIKRMGIQLDDMIPLIEFFISNGIEQLVYDTTQKSQNEIFESLRSHMQRNGRPNNYLIQEQQLLRKYQHFIEKQNKQSLEAREAKIKLSDQNQRAIQTKRKNLAKQVIELVQNEGEEEIKKMPFRNYLMEFVVPTLNEGLLEVSNIIPNDPVDLLAEYLYQKSYDV